MRSFTFQNKTPFLLFFLILHFSAVSTVTLAQNSVIDEIKSAIHKTYDSTRRYPLSVQQMPDLADELIDFRVDRDLANYRGIEPIDFYNVRVAAFSIEGDRIVSRHEFPVQVKDPYWLVGVDRDRQLYLLEGFDNCESSFERLVRKAGIKVETAARAEGLLYLYMKTCGRDVYYSELVSDEMALNNAVINDFRMRFSSRESRKKYRKWWKSLPSRIKKSIVPTGVVTSVEGFLANYYSYKNERIYANEVLIGREGIIKAGPQRRVY